MKQNTKAKILTILLIAFISLTVFSYVEVKARYDEQLCRSHLLTAFNLTEPNYLHCSCDYPVKGDWICN